MFPNRRRKVKFQMKICPKCQLEYDDEFAFCSKCGVPLIVKPQEYFCPTCGKSLGEKFDSFCPYCGQSFENNSHTSSTSNDTSNASTTTTITNYNLDVAREMLQKQEKQQVNKQPPEYNGKWLGFKGRIIRKDYIPKVLILTSISLLIMLVVPYIIESSKLIYKLKYYTSYFDFSYLKYSLYDLMFFGVVQIIIGILLLGLTIRRFRDTGKSIWIVIATYILSMAVGYFIPKAPYVGNIIAILPVLYGCFTKSVYEDESLRFNNKYETSNLRYACYGIIIVAAVALYSTISTYNRYGVQIQQAMSPNGYWVNIEDTCFIKIPVLNVDSNGIPSYQKSEVKKFTEKDFSNEKYKRIASGNTNTDVYFKIERNHNLELNDLTLYSPEVLKRFKEDDKEYHRKELSKINNVSVNDIVVRKAYKPEQVGSTYAQVFDCSVKGKTWIYYFFIDKDNRYNIGVEYPDKTNDVLKQSLENMVKNIIWNR